MDWRDVRRYLNGHRHPLARRAAERYAGRPTVGGTGLLTRPEWLPAEPLDLRRVEAVWRPAVPPPAVTGAEAAVTAGHGRYSAALAALDPPRLLANRTCYRLVEVAWPRLTFTAGRYFDGVDVGEAAAHEFAQAVLTGDADLPLRTAVGDPTDLARRPVLPAISVLTLRRGRTGPPTFVLHHRDPAKVAHGGGLYQVMPVGVVQPSGEAAWALRADLDLWRCAVREYAEEFLGRDEVYGDAVTPFDYAAWPFHRRMTEAAEAGQLRPYLLGLGVDPLSFATDLLAVAVFDAEVYDALFGGMTGDNTEGRVAAASVPFTAETVARFTRHEPMQAAGAAVLELAWRHRETLGLG